jgi:hypothetical protein
MTLPPANSAVLARGDALTWNDGAGALCLVAPMVFIVLPTGR